MSNATNGEFQLSLAGKTYTLKMGTAALAATQETIFKHTAYLPTIEEMLSGVLHQRVLYMQAFIWGGFRKHHPDVTFDGVADIIDASDQQDIQALLGHLGLSATPDPKDVSDLTEGADPQKAQTGKGGRKKARATGGDRSTSSLAASA